MRKLSQRSGLFLGGSYRRPPSPPRDFLGGLPAFPDTLPDTVLDDQLSNSDAATETVFSNDESDQSVANWNDSSEDDVGSPEP